MIIKANSFHISLKDKSVQAVITSPPYWGLREFDIPKINIGGWLGHYGLEPTLRAYIDHTLLWIQEVWRVLRDDGVFFLNIGDCYADRAATPAGMKRKCKLLVPHRVAISMTSEGWILRNDIIWHKPNGLPESVKDRFSKRCESIFMFAKSAKYYFNLDAVRIKTGNEMPTELHQPKKSWADHSHDLKKGNHFQNHVKRFSHPKGKNPGDVWRIPSQAYLGAHYATFPEKIVERMILCCTRPRDVILDPFAGSGTTGRVAIRLGRNPILLDLGYHDLQKQRTKNVQKEMIQ